MARKYSHIHPVLFEEILSLTSKKSVSEIMRSRGSLDDKVGGLSFYLRDVFSRSTICSYGGLYYYFDGKTYSPLSVEELEELIIELLEKIGLSYSAISRHYKGIIRLLSPILQIKELKYDNRYFGFNNGVLDTITLEFMQFTPDIHLLSCVDYDYIPEMDTDQHCYLWKAFLDRVLPDDRSQKLLQEFLGAMFISRREVHIDAMMFLIGDGDNGKAVVYKTIMGLFGENNISNFDLSELMTSRNKMNNIAEINGKRLNYCPDITTKELNSQFFKSLISGEPQPAKRHRLPNFTAMDIPLFMVSVNTMPSTRNLSDDFFRRLILIPFLVSISEKEQDRSLAHSLRDEYPAIFNWVLRGRERFVKQRYIFSRSAIIDGAILAYKEEANNVIKWLSDREFVSSGEITDDKVWISVKYLHNDYKLWCARHSLKPYAIMQLGSFLKKTGFEKRYIRNVICYAVYAEDYRLHKGGIMQIDKSKFLDNITNK